PSRPRALAGRCLPGAPVLSFGAFRPPGGPPPCPQLLAIRLLSQPLRSGGQRPAGLTKKRATFGPPPGGRTARRPNLRNSLKNTLFFTGRDPAGAEVSHDRPPTPPRPAGPHGRGCLKPRALPVGQGCPRGSESACRRSQSRGKRPVTCASSRQTVANEGQGGSLNSS